MGAFFEEFAKRFSVVATAESGDKLRDLQSIIRTGGGDREGLTFVLLNLFTRNGIDAETVPVFRNEKDVGPEGFPPGSCRCY
jgi:hypothetical protein